MEEAPPPFLGDITFDWYDPQAESDWAYSQKKSAIWGLLVGPLLILSAFTGIFIGAGIGLALISNNLISRWRIRRWDKGFIDEIAPARANFTVGRLIITRGEEVILDLAIKEIAGFTYSVKRKPQLIIHGRKDQPDVELQVYFPETYSVGFMRTMATLDERLPFEAKRGFVSEDRVPIRSQGKWRAPVILLVALVLIAGAVLVMQNEDSLDSPVLFAVIIAGVVMGPVLIAISVIEFARQVSTRTEHFEKEFRGEELCRFEPDAAAIGGPSAASWVCGISVFLLLPPAVAFPETMWWSIPLSLIFIALFIWTRHMKRAWFSTVVLTDQYLYVIQARKLYSGRHGQFPIVQGSVIFGRHITRPANAISFGFQKPVTVILHIDDLNEFIRQLEHVTVGLHEMLDAQSAE